LPSIKISLQNHLRRYLIDISPGVARFFASITQRPMRCNGGQPFVPCDDWAWKNRSQFFYEPECFGCGGADLAIHLPRDSHYDVVDFLLANYLSQSRRGLAIGLDCFQRMCQEL
jgi:hypothetical protein